MQTNEFRIVLNKIDINEEEADALYARCKDGTLVTEGQVTFLDFDREADSLDQAVRSAIADINAAGFRGVRVESEAEWAEASVAMTSELFDDESWDDVK